MATTQDTYFSSYNDLSVHKLMLSDKPRMQAYCSFITNNVELFKNKIVMDVGAGTGILSLCAARAGAKQVYAVEASEMSNVCKQIVEDNGYSDTITVIHKRVEDIEEDTVPKVDIMLSEWMGFYLLHESMLLSVVAAREKFLAFGGLMVPSIATIYSCPVNVDQVHKEAFEFWKDVEGFNMSAMLPLAQQDVFSRPAVVALEPQQMLATPKAVATFDLGFVQPEELKTTYKKVGFQFLKDAILDGISCWFEVEFHTSSENNDSSPTVLKTGPDAPPTHWKQTTVLLPQRIRVQNGETIGCIITLDQDEENLRHYNIGLELTDDPQENLRNAIKDHLVRAMETQDDAGNDEAE